MGFWNAETPQIDSCQLSTLKYLLGAIIVIIVGLYITLVGHWHLDIFWPWFSKVICNLLQGRVGKRLCPRRDFLSDI